MPTLFGDLVVSSWGILDEIYVLTGLYRPSLHGLVRARINPAQKLIVPCTHKGLVSLAVATRMTCEGLYGPARPLLRHAFESLLIGKVCSVDAESTVFDRWDAGEDVWIGRDVLGRLHPEPVALKALWRLLSNYVHASTFASQPLLGVSTDGAKHAIEFNLALCCALGECLSHLWLVHVVTRSVRYYQEVLGDPTGAKASRQRLAESLRLARQYLGRDARNVIREYRARWLLK